MNFYFLLLLTLGQRLLEINKGNINFKINAKELIYPKDIQEKNRMIVLHSSWFLSCFIEFLWHGQFVSNTYVISGTAILLLCQIIRFQSIHLLGKFWTHFPVAFKNQPIITSGPYRYIRHPNYAAVIVEISVIPLMGKCFWTASVFGLLNFLFLKTRISIEERALVELPQYEVQQSRYKLIPYVF